MISILFFKSSFKSSLISKPNASNDSNDVPPKTYSTFAGLSSISFVDLFDDDDGDGDEDGDGDDDDGDVDGDDDHGDGHGNDDDGHTIVTLHAKRV